MINWRTNLGKKNLYKHKAKLNQNTKSIPKESKLKSYSILYRRHIGPDKPTLRGNLPPAARTNCGQALSQDQALKHNDSIKDTIKLHRQLRRLDRRVRERLEEEAARDNR
ncbi:hypothetical protein VN97_g277 [Penicillium thymicola]|uniref:Uncharacterized protein n=1 Tax=Penicillium thymicola TaxID=293382 RepID=A0AAI9TT26_PENTH|nr:hypothetical protein VN97_g277 [Penicillium thymicola]